MANKNKFKKLNPLNPQILRYAVLILNPYYGIALVLFLIAFSTVCEASVPFFFKFIIDTLLSKQGPNAIVYICGLIFILVLVGGLAKYLGDRIISRSVHKFGYALRKDIFSVLTHLSFGFSRSKGSGEWLSLLNNDVETIEHSFKNGLQLFSAHLFFLIWCFVAMAILDYRLLLVSLIIFFAGLIVLRLKSIAFKGLAYECADRRARMNRYLHEFFNVFPAVKAYVSEEKEERNFDDLSVDYFKTNLRDSYFKEAFQRAHDMVNSFVIIILLGMGSSMVMAGRLSLGTFVAFISYLGFIRGRVSSAAMSYIPLKQSLAIFGKLMQFKYSAEVDTHADNKKSIKQLKGELNFLDIYFSYPGQNRPVFKNVSLFVNPGDKIVLTGASGVGKTTLLSLLLGFYVPTRGAILIDGQDAQEINITSLRKHIACAFQENILFNRSIEENISYGKDSATPEEIKQTAALSDAHGFIASLPLGYQTIIGSKGVDLSGGEKQRIAIARVVLTKAPIMIFDEATSYLNDRQEFSIYQEIINSCKDSIIFIVSHRPQNIIKLATKVFAFEDGYIRCISARELLDSPQEITESPVL